MICNKIQFNGYLNSLRSQVKIVGIDEFCIFTGYDRGRVLKLYSSNARDSAYIEDLLNLNYGEFEDKFYDFIIRETLLQKKIKNKERDKERLKNKLHETRKKFCKIGLKRVVEFLKRNTDTDSFIILKCIEIENLNIKAKINIGFIAQQCYKEKHDMINELIDFYIKNNLNFGLSDSDIDSINSIIFFDTPAGQISWHSEIELCKYKKYNGRWDNLNDSTLSKIEKYLMNKYKF